MTDRERDRWTATPARVLLRERLLAKNTPRLTACYWEALRVLREGDDEVRFGIAGHLLRELQSGLPKHMNVPEEKGGGLGVLFIWLQGEWRKVTERRPGKVGNELWADATIDRPLARFLAKFDDKIASYAQFMPRRRARHLTALGALDPGFGAAPATVQEAAVDSYMRLNRVFNGATHMSADPNEFEPAVEALEAFLIDRLAPKTFDKFDEISALVEDAEGHADA